MQQGDDNTGAGSTDRVTQGDSAAVDVDLAHVEVQLACHSDGLCGERLICLDQIDVIDGQAGLCQSGTGSGNGTDAHDLGIDTALAPADQLRHGLQTVLGNRLAGSQHDGGSAVIDAGSVGSGHALLALILGFLSAGHLEGVDHFGIGGFGADGERTAQLGNTLNGHACLGILIDLEIDHSLLDLHGHGDDFLVELAGSHSGLGLLLGSGGESILLSAGDTPDVVDVLSGGAHVIVVISVPQTVLNHGVDQLLVAHASAPAGVHGSVGSSTHVLGTAADNDVGIAGQDGASAFDDGFHTGTADHTDGVSGNGIGDASLDGDLACDVLALSSGQDAAEHQLVNILRSDVGALQRFLNDDSAHLRGGSVLQGAAEGTDSGSAAIDNIQIFHGFVLL